jgi:hypothetical protein
MRFVFTPTWFIGKDVLIEAFSFIVLFIFSILAIRSYKLNKNRKFLYLGTGFALIGLAQFANVLTKLVLYYDVGPSQQIGAAIVAAHVLSSVDIFYYVGFFLHKFLTLSGLYIICRLPREHRSIWDSILIIYFIVISALGSQEIFYLFHITALVILLFIGYNYYKLYMRNQFKNTLILLFAFLFLGLSQLIYILSPVETMYVLANILELITYIVLLILVVIILYYGKKTKPNGHHIRHVSDNSRKKKRN